jgi:hypothetical protein
MTSPSQPYQQPQQGYPAQQPNYAPQPGYPAPPQQPYQQPAPQGYAQPQAPVQPVQQPFQHPSPDGFTAPELRNPRVAQPSLRDFMNQPAGGGNSLSFMQAGTRYTGTVIRTVTGADVDYATEMQDQTKIAKFRDGREKLIMRVPLLLDQPSAAYPDGTAVWIIKSNDRNELMRAMEAAGAQIDPELGFYRIQAGDWLSVTYTHDQPSGRGLNARKVKVVEYRVGNGVPPQMPQLAAPPQQQFAPPPQYQYQQPAPPVNPGYAPQPQQPQYAQGGYVQQPQQPAFQDPGAYQQATGQPMPPPQQYQQPQQPQGAYYDLDPRAMQQYQQPQLAPQGNGFPPIQGAPAAQPGFTPGASPTAPASPSNGQPAGTPPPDWPADVPFIKGLTPDMARTAAALRVMNQQPQ